VGQYFAEEIHNALRGDVGEEIADVWNQGEKKNDCRENGQDKIVRHTVGAIHDLIVGEILKKESEYLIERYVFVFTETHLLHPGNEYTPGVPLKK
jgi:hypothetical protein